MSCAINGSAGLVALSLLLSFASPAAAQDVEAVSHEETTAASNEAMAATESAPDWHGEISPYLFMGAWLEGVGTMGNISVPISPDPSDVFSAFEGAVALRSEAWYRNRYGVIVDSGGRTISSMPLAAEPNATASTDACTARCSGSPSGSSFP